MAMDTVESVPTARTIDPPPTAFEKSSPVLTAMTVNTPPTSLEESSPADQSSDVLGPDNIPGYDKVLNLANFLVKLREDSFLSSDKVQQLICLWEQLLEYDRKRTVFPRRYTKKPWSGKFGGRGKNVAPGVESITKAVLGPNKCPAQWPNCNRYTEATCELLLDIFHGDQRKELRVWSSWRLILTAFHNIQKVVMKSQEAMEKTEIQLPLLNKRTLTQWYNMADKERDQKILLQGLNMPTPRITDRGLSEARQKPAVLPSGDTQKFKFKNPTSTAGLASKRRVRKRKAPEPCQPSQSSRGTFIPILPAPAAICINFPVMMEQQNVVIQPSQSTSTASTNPSTSRPTRKYTKPTFIACRKCGENRKDSQTHRSYMFNIYCEKKETVPFEDWKATLKAQKQTNKKINITTVPFEERKATLKFCKMGDPSRERKPIHIEKIADSVLFSLFMRSY